MTNLPPVTRMCQFLRHPRDRWTATPMYLSVADPLFPPPPKKFPEFPVLDGAPGSSSRKQKEEPMITLAVVVVLSFFAAPGIIVGQGGPID